MSLYMHLGGYFHGRRNLTYGVDLEKIRVMGVLQVFCLGMGMDFWLSVALYALGQLIQTYKYELNVHVFLAFPCTTHVFINIRLIWHCCTLALFVFVFSCGNKLVLLCHLLLLWWHMTSARLQLLATAIQ